MWSDATTMRSTVPEGGARTLEVEQSRAEPASARARNTAASIASAGTRGRDPASLCALAAGLARHSRANACHPWPPRPASCGSRSSNSLRPRRASRAVSTRLRLTREMCCTVSQRARSTIAWCCPSWTCPVGDLTRVDRVRQNLVQMSAAEAAAPAAAAGPVEAHRNGEALPVEDRLEPNDAAGLKIALEKRTDQGSMRRRPRAARGPAPDSRAGRRRPSTSPSSWKRRSCRGSARP